MSKSGNGILVQIHYVICEYTYSNHFTPLLFIPFYHILLTAAELRGMNPKRFKKDAIRHSLPLEKTVAEVGQDPGIGHNNL